MFNRFLSGPLFDKASEEGNGGGAGNNPVLDAKAVQTMIDSSINGFGKRIEGDFTKKFGALTDQLSGISKALEKGTPSGDGDGDGDGDEGSSNKGKGGSSKVDPTVKAQLDSQQKTIDRLNKKLDEESKARTDASKKAEETERFSSIRTEVGKYKDLLPEVHDDAFELFDRNLCLHSYLALG